MFKDKFYKKALKMFCLFVLFIAAARFSKGAVVLLLVLVGTFAGMGGKAGIAIGSYVTLPILVMINSVVLPKSSALWALSTRIGMQSIAIGLIIGACNRRGNHMLPFAGLLLYLMVAIVSSAGGWAPIISYLKLVNFTLFLLGIWLGTRNLQSRPKDAETLRVYIFTVAAFVVLGSIAVLPFPSIAYSTTLKHITAELGSAAAAAEYHAMRANGGQVLFAGILAHSQALAPALAISFTWILCDMLFIEQKLKMPHLLLIGACLPLLFMTRSRVALLSLTSGISIVSFYAVKKIHTPSHVKRRLKKYMIIFGVLMVGVMGVLEAKNRTVTRWIRKTQDVEGDQRSLTDAVTSSRQGLMEESMYEFRRNPLFGSGFQVSAGYQGVNELLFSAPIEKGVLPVMVLGETGIVGSTCFVIFLFMFYTTASRKHYVASITMFTLLLATNMGEATFFSPGGIGGFLWTLSVIGGFVIDTAVLYPRKLKILGYHQ